MKKMFLIGAFFCGVFATTGYADITNYNANQASFPQSTPSVVNGSNLPSPCVPDEQCGPCYCLYAHYQPRYYNACRTVEEQVNCPKQCCRYVTQYYNVPRCRWVPEYYTEVQCRQVPEYYEVNECKTVQRTITEPCCDLIPQYYWHCTDSCGSCNNRGY